MKADVTLFFLLQLLFAAKFKTRTFNWLSWKRRAQLGKK